MMPINVVQLAPYGEREREKEQKKRREGLETRRRTQGRRRVGEEPLALFSFFPSLSTSSAKGPHSLVTVSKRVIRTLDGYSSTISQQTRAPDGLCFAVRPSSSCLFIDYSAADEWLI